MTAGELVFLIRADKSGLKEGLDSSEKDAKAWGERLSAWSVAKGQLIADFAKRAVSSTVDVVKNVTREAIKAYAEFEQLEGGTQLLYGNASEKVMKRAAEAYKTVQMSQTDYLQQANSFATGLKKYLGDDADAAADLADNIITAQADVVAATGASQDSVANAFAGIMKGNYTMLDNLQLGITPTKQGMQDLIKQVNDWNKANGKATKYNIKNLADQQAALVDYIEMQGLAGYAGKEAADTIEGTMASTKAAWKNLLIAFGSGKDVKAATKNLANSFKQLAKNMIPVVKNVFQGIGEFIKESIPQISEWLSKGIQKLKESDNPILQLVGNGLEKLKELGSVAKSVLEGDIPSAIERLSTSNDPLANLLGGGLQLLWDVCKFFQNTIGLDNTIKLIAGGFLMFKTITIATSFSNFLDKLIKLGSGNKLQQLKELFSGKWTIPGTDGGDTPPTGGSSADTKKGKTGWLSSLVNTVKDKAVIGASLAKAGASLPLAGLLGSLVLGGVAGGKMIQANLNDEDLNAIYGDNNGQNSVIDTMNDAAVKAAKAYWDVYQDTGSEVAKNARENLQKILSEQGYVNDEQGVGLIENAFENILNESDIDGLGERLQERFSESTEQVTTLSQMLSDMQTMQDNLSQFVGKLVASGEQQEQGADSGEKHELYDTWKLLKDYYTSNIEGNATDISGAEQFAKDYMQWYGDASHNPIFDQLSEILDYDEWEKFSNSMSELSEGVEHTGEKEKAEYFDAINNVVTKIEEIMSGGAEEVNQQSEQADQELTDRFKNLSKDVGTESDKMQSAFVDAETGVTTGGDQVKSALDDTGSKVESGAESVVQALLELVAKIKSVKIPGSVGGEGGFFDNVLGSLLPGHAKGLYTVPEDDYIARLHRDEMVLTKSQARRYKEGDSSGVNLKSLERGIVASVREGMNDAQVNSYMDGKQVTGGVNSRTSRAMKARRFAPAW